MISAVAIRLSESCSQDCVVLMMPNGSSISLHGPYKKIEEFAERIKREVAEKLAQEAALYAKKFPGLTPCPHNWSGGYCDLCGAVKEGAA